MNPEQKIVKLSHYGELPRDNTGKLALEENTTYLVTNVTDLTQTAVRAPGNEPNQT